MHLITCFPFLQIVFVFFSLLYKEVDPLNVFLHFLALWQCSCRVLFASMLALVRVWSAGCPARESVAAWRGRSCRCGPAADRTPALQEERTSLHYASEGGHLAVVQTLLDHGADVAARDNDGQTALDVARDEEVKAALREHGDKHS